MLCTQLSPLISSKYTTVSSESFRFKGFKVRIKKIILIISFPKGGKIALGQNMRIFGYKLMLRGASDGE